MTRRTLELKLRFCLAGIEYDSMYKNPAAQQRIEKAKQRAEGYKQELKEMYNIQ